MQVDFSMPGRLGAEYVAGNDERKVPALRLAAEGFHFITQRVVVMHQNARDHGMKTRQLQTGD